MSTERAMSVQDYLIHALAGLGEKEGIEDQQRLWEGSDAGIRREVLVARARHEHSRLDGLRAGLTDKRAEVRERALELLMDGPYHPELTDLVAARLAHDDSEKVRHQAFELVTTLPADERFVPGLAAFLTDPQAFVRHLAVHHIRRAASQNAGLLKPVLELLDHPEARVRNNAQKALRYPNGLPEVLDGLLRELDQQQPDSKQLVSPALAFCQDRARRKAELQSRLDDKENFPRSVGAAYAMAWCAHPDLKPQLEVLLRDGNALYSSAGILGLEILDAKDMIHELRAMLGNDAHEPRDEDDYPDRDPG